LFRYLDQLRDWAVEQMDILSEFVPDQVKALKTPDDIPEYTVWEGVAVSDQYAVFMHCRYVRETWDAIFRDHEDSWDSNLAVHKRLVAVRSAVLGLDEAFVDPETREAREHDEAKRAKDRLRLIRQAVSKAIAPNNENIFDEDDGYTDV
jgi:hypothetical protein